MFAKKPTKFSPAFDRAGRIKELLRQFKAAHDRGEEILLTRTKGNMELDWGLTPKTVWSYFQTMEDAGKIQIDQENDRILWLGE